jgi:ribosomal protein L7/L12
MDDLAELARALTAAGATRDEVTRELVSRTDFPIAVIKAVRTGLDLSLTAAKDLVLRNLEPAARETAERMWDDLRAAGLKQR